VVFVPAAPLRQAFETDSAFALAIFQLTSRLLRSHVMELKSQKLRSGPERLAAWLLRQVQPQQPTILPYNKRRIAARLGMTPENLSRSFAVIAPHGVTRQASRITIADPEGLARFAGSNTSIDDHRL